MTDDKDKSTDEEKSADEDLRLDELSKVKDSWTYLSDTKLVRFVDRYDRDDLVHDFSLPIRVREIETHVDPDQWGAGFLSVHDWWIPIELTRDIHTCTPQALLRDLHRPVRPDQFPGFEVIVPRRDVAGLEAVADARAALIREARPVVEPTVRAVIEYQEEWRSFVRTRWQPHIPDDKPHPAVQVIKHRAKDLG